MKHYVKRDSPFAVVQGGTVSPRNHYLGGTPQIMEAVVVGVSFVDLQANRSAQYERNQEARGGSSDTDPPLTHTNIGSRVECDVYILRMGNRGYGYQILHNVPVLQRGGGFGDADIWVPKPATNFYKQVPVTQDPSQIDGDVVLVGFIGGIYPTGAVILGAYPHKKNFIDHPRSLVGDATIPKRYGDGTRKDGYVKLVRYNGTVAPYIDRTGNLLFDTTEANRTDSIEDNTNTHTIRQDEVGWGGDQDSKNPGGGDVRFKIKNNRRFQIDFTNNQSLTKDYDKSNPREFSETGYVRITQGSGTRVIDIDMDGAVEINVTNSGGAAGTLIINTAESIEGITLGGTLLDRLATKDFVEKLFMTHIHQTGVGPTTGPVYVDGAPVGFLFPGTDNDTGVEPLSSAKIFTTKVQGE